MIQARAGYGVARITLYQSLGVLDQLHAELRIGLEDVRQQQPLNRRVLDNQHVNDSFFHGSYQLAHGHRSVIVGNDWAA